MLAISKTNSKNMKPKRAIPATIDPKSVREKNLENNDGFECAPSKASRAALKHVVLGASGDKLARGELRDAESASTCEKTNADAEELVLAGLLKNDARPVSAESGTKGEDKKPKRAKPQIERANSTRDNPRGAGKLPG